MNKYYRCLHSAVCFLCFVCADQTIQTSGGYSARNLEDLCCNIDADVSGIVNVPVHLLA